MQEIKIAPTPVSFILKHFSSVVLLKTTLNEGRDFSNQLKGLKIIGANSVEGFCHASAFDQVFIFGLSCIIELCERDIFFPFLYVARAESFFFSFFGSYLQ